MPSQSSTTHLTSGSLDQRADPVLERVRGGEEQAAVEPEDHDAGDLLVVRVLERGRGRPGCRAPVPGRHPRLGGDGDQPEQRQPDPDDDAGEDAERQACR